jgi:hypothetical protein
VGLPHYLTNSMPVTLFAGENDIMLHKISAFLKPIDTL